MGQKHPSLAVGNLTQRPTILPSHSHRLHPLLGEIAAVQHPHRLRIIQPRTQILLQTPNHAVVVPASLGKKPLHRPRRYRNHLREVLGVAPLLRLHQQALQIVAAVFPPLLAAKGWREVVVEILKGLIHPLKVRHIHHPTPLKPSSYRLTILPNNPSL